ncbi:MAG: hypothetical protein Q9211_005422 [Gyalolechia sp. 1 TL-2023]
MAQFCYNQILIGQTGVYKNAFVPDSASAIPNTVTEQQRILAQVRAGNFLPRVLGVDPEIEPVLGIGGTGHVLDHVKRLPLTGLAGSGLLFSVWPAVEVGVGLIACNLPSLSFRVARALPKQLKRGWNVSMSGIRRAAERLTLGSDSRRTHNDPHMAKAGDDGTASEWYDSRRAGKNPGEQGSVTTVSNIPLVHLESKTSGDGKVRISNGYLDGTSESTKSGNSKTIYGFDAV